MKQFFDKKHDPGKRIAVNVLAFDTCFAAVSVAVCRHGGASPHVLSEGLEALTIGHAERLLPMIDEVMAEAGLTFAGLDRIAVTLGPGGFTGLRVGVSAARALALATGLPVVGMSSLALMAEGATHMLGPRFSGRSLVVAVDARRGALYAQGFGGAALGAFMQPHLTTADEAAAALPAPPLTIVGSGAEALATAAHHLGVAADIVTELSDLQPHARHLALFAPRLPVLERVTPLYLRAADAKPSTVPPLSRRSGP